MSEFQASLSAPYFARMAVHLRRGPQPWAALRKWLLPYMTTVRFRSKLVLPTVRSASPSRSRDRN